MIRSYSEDQGALSSPCSGKCYTQAHQRAHLVIVRLVFTTVSYTSATGVFGPATSTGYISYSYRSISAQPHLQVISATASGVFRPATSTHRSIRTPAQGITVSLPLHYPITPILSGVYGLIVLTLQFKQWDQYISDVCVRSKMIFCNIFWKDQQFLIGNHILRHRNRFSKFFGKTSSQNNEIKVI